MSILSTSAVNAPADLWWVLPAITVLTLLVGSGGVVAWRRQALDRKLGVANQATSETDAMSARWEKMIQTQTESLVKPLRQRLIDLTEELNKLEAELEGMKIELKLANTKYSRAIQYVRTLLTWIRARRSIPDEPPAPPAEIAEDI